MKLKETIQAYLMGTLSDPIAKILAQNSHLTKTQLETLLIDILSDNLAETQLKYDEKARLRLSKAEISRGSFNRTLKQSKENVTKSVYTLLLLGYLGLLESTSLDPYITIANKLQAYVETWKNMPTTTKQTEEQFRIMEMIRTELEKSLRQLSSSPQSMT